MKPSPGTVLSLKQKTSAEEREVKENRETKKRNKNPKHTGKKRGSR